MFDGELTGSQIRNISAALGGWKCIDRTMLILGNLPQPRVTNEGKLQTELALLRYRLPRLQGMGEALSRQGGGGGGGGGARRGAGETKLELDRRHVHARIDALAEKLAEMEKRRGETRKARAKTGMPVVSLGGLYQRGQIQPDERPVRPQRSRSRHAVCHAGPHQPQAGAAQRHGRCCWWTRSACVPPAHNLVEAFKSTLEEAAWSDVIIRVADAGDEQREEQLAVTDEVLDGLDCADIPQPDRLQQVRQARSCLSFDPDILLTSAKTGYGLDSCWQSWTSAQRPGAHHPGAAALRQAGPCRPHAGARQRAGGGIPGGWRCIWKAS